MGRNEPEHAIWAKPCQDALVQPKDKGNAEISTFHFDFNICRSSSVALYLSFVIANLLVEVFALQADKVLSRLQDSTFDGDGTGCVDVVSGDHTDSDACSLTFRNSIRNLHTGRIEGPLFGLIQSMLSSLITTTISLSTPVLNLGINRFDKWKKQVNKLQINAKESG